MSRWLLKIFGKGTPHPLCSSTWSLLSKVLPHVQVEVPVQFIPLTPVLLLHTTERGLPTLLAPPCRFLDSLVKSSVFSRLNSISFLEGSCRNASGKWMWQQNKTKNHLKHFLGASWLLGLSCKGHRKKRPYCSSLQVEGHSPNWKQLLEFCSQIKCLAFGWHYTRAKKENKQDIFQTQRAGERRCREMDAGLDAGMDGALVPPADPPGHTGPANSTFPAFSPAPSFCWLKVFRNRNISICLSGFQYSAQPPYLCKSKRCSKPGLPGYWYSWDTCHKQYFV